MMCCVARLRIAAKSAVPDEKDLKAQRMMQDARDAMAMSAFLLCVATFMLARLTRDLNFGRLLDLHAPGAENMTVRVLRGSNASRFLPRAAFFCAVLFVTWRIYYRDLSIPIKLAIAVVLKDLVGATFNLVNSTRNISDADLIREYAVRAGVGFPRAEMIGDDAVRERKQQQ